MQAFCVNYNLRPLKDYKNNKQACVATNRICDYAHQKTCYVHICTLANIATYNHEIK